MRILCIGTQCNVKKNIFTGQSVMFDGICNNIQKKHIDIDVIDVSPRFNSNASVFRAFDYLIVLFVLFVKSLTKKYDVGYLVTSQSKRGFIRDRIIVDILTKKGCKIIAHQYGGNYNQLVKALDENGVKELCKMLNKIERIIVEGNYMKSQFSFYENYDEKVVVIPNGLPVEGENIMKAKVYKPSEPFKIFYLSNLIYSKGYFDVLKAVDLLVNEDKLDVKCVFAGRFMSSVDDIIPGVSNKDDFDNYIAEHKLQDRIEYHTGLYGKEKDLYFYESNVFILPSYYINEGQPVSIIEAMAYGCVPIVTNYRHIPMMVNEHNGCYVEPRAPESIRQRIREMILTPELYSQKSKQSILDYKNNFRFEVYSEKVFNVINSI